jgi:hypothetical protein
MKRLFRGRSRFNGGIGGLLTPSANVICYGRVSAALLPPKGSIGPGEGAPNMCEDRLGQALYGSEDSNLSAHRVNREVCALIPDTRRPTRSMTDAKAHTGLGR